MERTAFLMSASFVMVLALGDVGAAERPAAGTSPTFTKDVAPILYNSCVLRKKDMPTIQQPQKQR